MSDRCDLSEDLTPSTAEAEKKTAEARRAAEEQAFADKLAKRPPPNPVECAEIENARKRTKARAPRIAMNIEERGSAGRAFYPDHSDEEVRFILLGLSSAGRILVVVHCYRENELLVRIISARKATKKEVRRYEERI